MREIAFRIDSISKQLLLNKVDDLKISLSELMRIVINNSIVFDLELDEFNEVITHETKLDKRIYVIIDDDINDKIVEIKKRTKLSVSKIMRLIVLLDNTKVIKSNYLDKCLNMLYSVGTQINQTAYQLNLDNIQKRIGYMSYKVALSRVISINQEFNILEKMLEEVKYNYTDNAVLLVNKKDKFAWIFQLSSAQNNLQQIGRRLETDYNMMIIKDDLFNSILNLLLDITEQMHTFRKFIFSNFAS